MKLIIQIPCFNEREHLGATFADLPRCIPGIDEIETLVIDDGSTDGTSDLAQQLGVHHIIRFSRNRGLAAAHMAGLDAAMRLGADIVVNTDADNQYRGEDIAKLIEPILAKHADIAVGDRQTDTIEHFSPLKRLLQRWGSHMVRKISRVNVTDATSGFRAISRYALASLFIHNRFTYTLESIIQAGNLGMAVENVKIRTNKKIRESRLFSSIPEYLRRNGAVVFRSYSMYFPIRVFGYVASALFGFGMLLGIRFLYYFFQNPGVSSHIQSLQVGVGAVVMSFVVGLMALLGDLIATNRRLSEEILARVRRMEAIIAQRTDKNQLDGIFSTGAQIWRAGKKNDK
ncbi:MAG: glycosyltransferase family 2 protein [Gammaproteobacteria bacterium]|nr:glycosyltransferase family 2 protein [Gammaproteobacteria bacterium]